MIITGSTIVISSMARVRALDLRDVIYYVNIVVDCLVPIAIFRRTTIRACV